MNRTIYLFAFILASTFINAQTTNLNVSESTEFKDDVKAYGDLVIFTTETSETALVRKGKKDILFDIFDKDLNKVHTSLIESDKKEVIKSNVTYGDVIKVFTLYSPKKKERIIYCHTFNIKTKTHSKKQLLKKTIDKKFPLFSGGRKRETSFSISPNGQYVAMATDDLKKNSNAYTIHVFDTETLDLVYSKSYKDKENKFFRFNDLVVTNDAIAYSLGKLYKSGKFEKDNGDANYNFVVYQISETEVNSNLVTLENEHIGSLNINYSGDNLQLIGFYSEKDSGKIKGGCSFNVNPTSLEIIDKKSFELPKQVFQDLYNEEKASRKKKKGKEFSNFYTDYIIEDSLGNTYLVAEEFFVTQVYISTGVGGGYWQTIHHYNDILILKFNNTGNLDWGRSIFKNSTTPSYNVFLKDDKLHVILNSGKNLTEKKDGRTKVSKGWFESSSLYDIVFDDASGEVTYNKIQDNKGKTYYLPYYGTYNDGIFIMMSDGRKRKQFLKLQ